jgi:hypothetical protein
MFFIDKDDLEEILDDFEKHLFKEMMKEAVNGVTKACYDTNRDKFVITATTRFESKTYQTLIMISEKRIFNDVFKDFINQIKRKAERKRQKETKPKRTPIKVE